MKIYQQRLLCKIWWWTCAFFFFIVDFITIKSSNLYEFCTFIRSHCSYIHYIILKGYMPIRMTLQLKAELLVPLFCAKIILQRDNISVQVPLSHSHFPYFGKIEAVYNNNCKATARHDLLLMSFILIFINSTRFSYESKLTVK